MRVYETYLKDEILKIIDENGFPLEWEDHPDGGGTVRPFFDFTLLDEKVLALDPPIPEAEMTIVGGVVADEFPTILLQTTDDIWKYADE
jgi:hypothetical protein